LLTRAELLEAFRPHVEGWLARGVPLKHVTRHILGLFNGERGGRAFRQILSEGAHRPGADWSLVERALAPTAALDAA
jgi:tRNA-dihydrouridine synthase A